MPLKLSHASLTNILSVGKGRTVKKIVNGIHQIVNVPMSHASTPSGSGTRKSSLK